jgi:ribonuclease R
MTERRADEATREVISWLKCEYLMDRVGEQFTGVINAVTGFGLFVLLDDLLVEGLIHVTGLPKDYYYHEPSQQRMVGERSGRVYRLGQKLWVKVVRVNLQERKIDFDLVDSGADKTGRGRSPRKTQSKRRGSNSAKGSNSKGKNRGKKPNSRR